MFCLMCCLKVLMIVLWSSSWSDTCPMVTYVSLYVLTFVSTCSWDLFRYVFMLFCFSTVFLNFLLLPYVGSYCCLRCCYVVLHFLVIGLCLSSLSCVFSKVCLNDLTNLLCCFLMLFLNGFMICYMCINVIMML